MPQYNNLAHPKHPEVEETSPNRNHIITGKQFLLNAFGVGVSFFCYLYVNGNGPITSVGEERANLSAVVYL